MSKLYAQPYNADHADFYFDDYEAFELGMAILNKAGCEEVEIQFIDGTETEATVFKAAGIAQNNVEFWFDNLENLGDIEAAAFCYLCEYSATGDSLEEKYDKIEDVQIFEGSPADYAQDLTEECGDIPEHLQGYIDYERMAEDMRLNGEIFDLENGYIVTNANDA